MKEGKSTVSQNIKKGCKGEVSERLGSLVSLRLVKPQTTLFGMKTGRAVCTSQAWNLILFFNPTCTFILSFIHLLLFPPTTSHHPSAAIAGPPQQTLSNSRWESKIHPSTHIRLNQGNASALQSYFFIGTNLPTCP